jgi:hypothetical protein
MKERVKSVGQIKCGHYPQVVFVYRWSLAQVGLYLNVIYKYFRVVGYTDVLTRL